MGFHNLLGASLRRGLRHAQDLITEGIPFKFLILPLVFSCMNAVSEMKRGLPRVDFPPLDLRLLVPVAGDPA